MYPKPTGAPFTYPTQTTQKSLPIVRVLPVFLKKKENFFYEKNGKFVNWKRNNFHSQVTYLPPSTTTTTTTTPAPTYLPPVYQTPKSEGYFYPKPAVPFIYWFSILLSWLPNLYIEDWLPQVTDISEKSLKKKNATNEPTKTTWRDKKKPEKKKCDTNFWCEQKWHWIVYFICSSIN